MQEKNKTQKVQVYVIVKRKDRFLLLHRTEDVNVWEFPGGSIEFGESPENAAKRELLEETGIKARKIKLFDVSSAVYPDKKTMQICIFFFTEVGKKVSVLLTEHKEHRWVTLKEMESFDNLALSVKSILKKLKNSFKFHQK